MTAGLSHRISLTPQAWTFTGGAGGAGGEVPLLSNNHSPGPPQYCPDWRWRETDKDYVFPSVFSGDKFVIAFRLSDTDV